MAQLPDQQWIIEVNSRATGPFSIDQIRGLLKERQILPSFRVKKKSQNEDAWTTIADLIQSMENFSPPPRPQKSDESVTQINLQRTGLKNDATENLFETIQSVKEKNTFSTRNKPKIIVPKIRNRWGGPILILFGVTVTALGFTLWSAFKIVQLSQTTRFDAVPAPLESPGHNPSRSESVTRPSSPAQSRENRSLERTHPNSKQSVTLPSSATEGGQIQIYTDHPDAEKYNPVEKGRARPKDRSTDSRTDDEMIPDEELPPEEEVEERDQINNEGVAPNPVDSQ